jgi:hypothetical protein
MLKNGRALKQTFFKIQWFTKNAHSEKVASVINCDYSEKIDVVEEILILI